MNLAGESFGWGMMFIGAPLFGLLCPLAFGICSSWPTYGPVGKERSDAL